MNNLYTKKNIEDVIKNNTNFVFVSPHLDDAIFSAGGLIDKINKRRKKITILNTFTKASKPPYTISIKKFLKSCGYVSADDLFKARIKEDLVAARMVKAKVINLGFTDALWRQKGTRWILPELNYVYPIFRLSIAKGHISKHDNIVIKKLEKKIKQSISQRKGTVIFAPLAIGNHTDHLIVRNIISKSFKDVIYWEDYPYVKTGKADKNFIKIKGLKKVSVFVNRNIKNNLVNTYKSQVKAIFGVEKETVRNQEHYFI